jgi:hypothetical protein
VPGLSRFRVRTVSRERNELRRDLDRQLAAEHFNDDGQCLCAECVEDPDVVTAYREPFTRAEQHEDAVLAMRCAGSDDGTYTDQNGETWAYIPDGFNDEFEYPAQVLMPTR